MLAELGGQRCEFLNACHLLFSFDGPSTWTLYVAVVGPAYLFIESLGLF